MLEHIESLSCRFPVYRLASYQPDIDFLRELGIEDADGIQEMQDLFRSAGVRDADTFLDMPFRTKHRPRHRWQRKLAQTRFSDGSFPVFYASLEIQTSEAEARHWFVHQLPELPSRHQTLHYYRLKCDFEGTVKDLRPMLAKWPDLTHSTNYAFCNVLGLEAADGGLDAFLTPSARCSGGTNVPVFGRRALSNARGMEMVSLTFDYKSNTVEVAAVDV